MTSKKLSYNQQKMLDVIGEEWATIPSVFANVTRTSEALASRGLIETRREPGKSWNIQARRAAEAVRGV